MIKAFDCAQPLTDEVIEAAVDRGFKAVGRYYGSPGSSKLLTAAEVRRVSTGGLVIFNYFERTVGRPLMGRQAGEADGALAVVQAAACGQPPGSGICFAVDLDIDMDSPIQGTAVLAYFAGVKSQLVQFKLGVYGSGEVCEALTTAGLATYEILAGALGWQGSRAYSNSRLWEGQQYPELRATKSPLRIAIDPVDLVSLEAVGAWSIDGPVIDEAPTVAEPLVVAFSDAVATAVQLQNQLRVLGLYTGKIDGKIGPMTSAAAMRAWQLAQRG